MIDINKIFIFLHGSTYYREHSYLFSYNIFIIREYQMSFITVLISFSQYK